MPGRGTATNKIIAEIPLQPTVSETPDAKRPSSSPPPPSLYQSMTILEIHALGEIHGSMY